MKWAVLAGALLVTTTASAQSLGDAAAKERERRDKVHANAPPSRTVTDEELASNKGKLANEPDPVPPQASEPVAIRSEDPEASGRAGSGIPGFIEAQQPVKDESYWRARAAEAHNRIAMAQRRYDSLQRQILFGQPERYDESGQRVIYSIQTMKQKADAAEAELKAAQQALEDLDQEARRAGALPGWLR
jgi:hypothetical protein